MKHYFPGRLLATIAVIGLLLSCGCTSVKENPLPPVTKESAPRTTEEKAPDTSSATSSTLAPIDPQTQGYTGYMEPKGGHWAEYDLQTETGAIRQRITYLGTETLEGVLARGYEVLTSQMDANDSTLIQLWIDEQVKVVKYATREEGNVICKEAPGNLQGLYAMGAAGTPEEFNPSGNPSVETYTMPDGRMIDAAHYAGSDAETWVSSNVPFGLVKAVDKKRGVTVLSLYDYGTSGRDRSISKEELSGCKRMEELYRQADELSG
jgi:hypothetical protein